MTAPTISGSSVPALLMCSTTRRTHRSLCSGTETTSDTWVEGRLTTVCFYMTAVSKGLDPAEEEKKSKPGFYKKEADYNEQVLMELYEETFDENVVQDKDTVWIIEFYSDHCPIYARPSLLRLLVLRVGIVQGIGGGGRRRVVSTYVLGT
mmetsp:Transcript_9888/g.20125  ORF Transcript_9888/g.20125 Transcript_9888/m.20125 type:complete len:150 (-) Transcript_9888:44-493(-)